MFTLRTYRHAVDEQENNQNQQNKYNEADDIPLVVLPDDVTHCLERGHQPQKGCLGTAKDNQTVKVYL